MEVATQLRPFEKALDDLVNRFRSFYRNGDKGPPGLFDSRIKQDDERALKLDATLAKQDEKLDMLVAAKNVADGDAQGNERRRKSHFVMWGLIISALTLLLGVILALAGLYAYAKSGKPLSELIPEQWIQNQIDSSPTKVYAESEEPTQNTHIAPMNP